MDFDIVIVGAGAVGLAIARKLSKNYTVLLIEKNQSFGMETSSRNSEVIHAGLYYSPNSLKAKLCIEGNKLLYQYLLEKDISYNKCGKYIISIDANESLKLDNIYLNAKKNSCKITYVNQEELKSIYPILRFHKALFSENTGIFDSHSYMKSLENDALLNNAVIVYNHKFVQARLENNHYKIFIEDISKNKFDISTKWIINSAGLNSDLVANNCGIDIESQNYKLNFAKGSYFKAISIKNSFKHLIYPVPPEDNTFLGIHLTLDLNGELKFGPDFEQISRSGFNYSIDNNRKILFHKEIQRYLPDIKYEDLVPDYSGIRPRIAQTNNLSNDFIIKEESKNSYPRLINLIGIESPGLTSSLAIAELIYNLIKNY